jgi:serine phosphatase RsbU (regulator of sigma subunit)
MTYANAGHPPGVVIHRQIRREHREHGPGAHREHGETGDYNEQSAGLVRALSDGGPPLGLVPHARYQEGSVALSDGDLVVVVSDGITDALNASGEDIPRFVAAAVGGARTPRAACQALLAASANGPGPEGAVAWADDRTVLAFTCH